MTQESCSFSAHLLVPADTTDRLSVLNMAASDNLLIHKW